MTAPRPSKHKNKKTQNTKTKKHKTQKQKKHREDQFSGTFMWFNSANPAMLHF